MTQRVFIGRELIQCLPQIIDDAATTIRLAMYQLSPPSPTTHSAIKNLWQTLRAAPLRGVKCTAILSASSAFIPGQQYVSRTASELHAYGWEIVTAPDTKLMHAKTLIVDDLIMINGSHNWTLAGLMCNHEISTLHTDPLDIAIIIAWHQDLFQKLEA